MQKLALVVLVALLAVGAGWYLLEGSGGRGAMDRSQPEEHVASPGSASEPSELTAPSAAREITPARREEPAARARVVEQESFDLAGARWLEVGVVLPPGVPLEDRPMLLGFTRKDLEELGEWRARQVGEKLGLDDSSVDELGLEHHWSRRPLAASVRLPFPPEARSALLFLQSRYLHLDAVEVALEATSAVTLEPELGGWVTGRCIFPSNPPDPADVSIEFDGRERSGGLMGFARPDARDARVAPDLRFELRALSAERKYAVQAKAKGFVGHFELSFEIAPGQHRELEFAFRPGGVVAGTVRGEGQPLAGVRVRAAVKGTLPWNDDQHVESDADGTFRLAGLPGGTATLHAEKDGWLAAESEPLEIAEGRELGGIELALGAGNRIRGTVVWPDGRPAAEARVRALKARERWMEELDETESASDGSFVLGGLGDESVEVLARCKPDGAEAGASEAEHVDRVDGWMGSASGVASDATGLVLTLQRPHLVQGRVIDDAGALVTEFSIEAHLAGRPENYPEDTEHGFETSDGRFALEIGLPGEWIFHARGDEAGHRGEDVPLAVPHGGAELVLVLPRASSVSGLVVDPGGAPVAGAKIHATDDPRQAAFAFFGDGEGESDADGRFTLPSVRSGGYLHASHEDWAPSEHVALELTPGQARSDLVLHLRVGARITGEVFDEEGKPDPGQNVNCASGALAAMAFGLGGEHSSTTDAAGRFSFERVTPGKVTISAVPSEEELMQRFQQGGDETAFLSLMSEMRTASVEVADGGEAHVVLGAKPKRPVRVHGRVTEAGQPLAEKQVFAFAEGGALLQGMKFARTDADGRYELLLDRPGDYVFGVGQGDGFDGTGAPFFVEVPETDEFRQDLALPLGRIEGVALGPDGPASGVPIRLVTSAGTIGLDDLSEAHRATTAGDGAFSFDHLAPGLYALHFGSAVGDDSDGERYGQLVVDGLVVEPDRAVEGLVVHLSAPGKLAGTVRDSAGSPVGGISIFVRDAAGRAISASSCVSDATGRFTYSGISPGSITASARSSTLVSPESSPVEIRAGETSQLELVVQPGTYLVVSLLEDDEPVRARLSVVDESGRRVDDLLSMEDFVGILSEGFSSRERRVGPLAPGKYTLTATTLDGKDAKKSVMVEAGQDERNVKLRLK